MTTVPGYVIGELIYKSVDCEIRHAIREQDHLGVVLKMLTLDYPSPRDIIRYRQEYKILKLLAHIPSVIRVHDLVEIGQSLVLVLEDFGGVPLHQARGTEKFPLADLLGMSIQIAMTLGEIHAASVIHKDINPTNILINPETGQIRIIDFGMASLLSRESPVLGHPTSLEGTLLYISPEQTGRMNRSIDYRTDFYSLGATLYELLTGKPPFSSQSALELIHCHIAKQPPAPHDLDGSIPRVVSEIVMKLLAKTPERRYRGAIGIKADLERCLEQLKQNGQIHTFSIGQQDVSDRLNIPQKLYGRNEELHKLLNGFHLVAERGSRAVMMVSGRPGIGKTSLVQEIYKPMTQHQATFISGKFEQAQRDTPYFGLISACQQLTRYVLTEREERINQWKQELKQAVAPSGRVLIDFVPELEHLLGAQPPVPALAPAESQNRFFRTFQKFISVFARKTTPLVLFLDDLQWADVASLNLLLSLLKCQEELCLFFIGSYRDNEVSDSHPVMLMLQGLSPEVQVESISLSNLSQEDVSHLIAETFHYTPQEVSALTGQVYEKTRGNPFFVNEFLESLSIERLVYFDLKGSRWRWDLDGIQSRALTDNVFELLSEKIQRLDPQSQRSLSVAACLGSRFSLEVLTRFLKLEPKQTLSLLFPALNAGLIVAHGNAYQMIEHETASAEHLHQVEFRFSHDRIHAAAYALLPQAERQQTHHALGKLLLTLQPPDKDEGKVFPIINQLNAALDLVTQQDERRQLAQLNLRAGNKAKATAAYDQSLKYLLIAKELLGTGSWHRDYALTLSVNSEAAEAAFLATDFEQMWKLTQEVIEKALSPMGKVKPYNVQTSGHLALNRPVDGIHCALQLLRLLGMRFPEKPSKIQVLGALIRVKLLLRRKGIESLLTLPATTNASVVAAIQTMRSMTAALFQTNPMLHVLMMCKQIELLVKYGNSEWSGSVLASFGILFCGLLDDLDSGARIGKVALELSEKFPSAALKSRTVYVYNCFEGHVKEPLESTLKPLISGYQIGLETGDLEYAAFNAHVYCQHAYFQGNELGALEREMAAYSESIRSLRQQKLLGYNELFRQATLNLLGRADDPCQLVGEAFDEREALPRLKEVGDLSGIMAVHFHRCILSCLFGRDEQAVECAARAREHLDSTRGMFLFTRFFFYESLALLMRYELASDGQKKLTLKRVAANQKKLGKRASFAPMNHQHLYLLIEAERMRVLGNIPEAMAHYDEAIEAAMQGKFISDLGLIQQRTGEFYLQMGRAQVAKSYLLDARVSFLKWGATAKVQDVETRFDTVLSRQKPSSVRTASSTRIKLYQTTSFSSSTQQSTSQSLDLESVIKATQSISSQIVLTDLLDSLLKTASENAGSDKAALILARKDDFWVEALFNLEHDQNARLEAVPLESCGEVSAAIVRYVIRTRESVVLGDAANEGGFVQDTYVLERRPRSVLCIPIQRHTQVTGVLYMENNKATDTFTPDRVQLLGMIAAQAAISVDNAKLYSELQAALYEAKESARAKSEFLARTSHELRTPLNSIINIPRGLLLQFTPKRAVQCRSCSVRFELEADEALGPETACPECNQAGTLALITIFDLEADVADIYHSLEVVLKSGRHLLAVVNDILDMNKLEVGKMTLNVEEVDVSSVIHDVVDSIQPQAELRHIGILAPKVEKEVVLHADRTKLGQIIYNLVGNAIKFSPEGGNINVELQTEEAGILLSVHDEGIGIAKEHQQKIFDHFFQVDSGATRKTGGTGLGLAITKKLAELHGGKVWVESEVGKGSTFFIQLPWEAPLPSPEEPAAPALNGVPPA